MRNRKLWVSILAGIMAAVLVLGLVAGVLPELIQEADGASISSMKQDLQKLKDEKKELDKQIAEWETQIKGTTTEMKDIVAKKNAIDQQIFALHETVTNINEQIVAYNNLIADKQEELDTAETHLDELNKKYKERIRAMEEQGELSYWYVLFKANSFTDLLDRMSMIQEIAVADERRLAEMSKAAEEVAEAKNALEVERQGLADSKLEMEKTEKSLEAKRAEADQLLTELIAVKEEYEAYMAEVESQAKSNQEKQDRLEHEITLKEWEEKNNSSSSGSSSSGKPNDKDDYYVESNASWGKPCAYRRFSSPFGWRIHPVHGDWRFHQGVDLAHKKGTAIVASRAGTVTTAKYGSSSGYWVEIDHGDGFTSRYLHMTHYIVKKGDKVEKGQKIGEMGSTGVSTGPHLHFAILYKGKFLNPAKYINF